MFLLVVNQYVWNGYQYCGNPVEGDWVGTTFSLCFLFVFMWPAVTSMFSQVLVNHPNIETSVHCVDSLSIRIQEAESRSHIIALTWFTGPSIEISEC